MDFPWFHDLDNYTNSFERPELPDLLKSCFNFDDIWLVDVTQQLLIYVQYYVSFVQIWTLRVELFLASCKYIVIRSNLWDWTGPRLHGSFFIKLLFPQERWEKADLEKNVLLEGFVAFGGGKNQCPGRLEKLTVCVGTKNICVSSYVLIIVFFLDKSLLETSWDIFAKFYWTCHFWHNWTWIRKH